MVTTLLTPTSVKHYDSLLGHCHGLSDEETKDLRMQADIDGNGVLDYKEFQTGKFISESVEDQIEQEFLLALEMEWRSIRHAEEADSGFCWP